MCVLSTLNGCTTQVGGPCAPTYTLVFCAKSSQCMTGAPLASAATGAYHGGHGAYRAERVKVRLWRKANSVPMVCRTRGSNVIAWCQSSQTRLAGGGVEGG